MSAARLQPSRTRSHKLSLFGSRPLVYSHTRTQPSFVLQAAVVNLAPISLTEQKNEQQSLILAGSWIIPSNPNPGHRWFGASELNWDWCPAWGLVSFVNCTDGHGEGTWLLIQSQCGVMLKCVLEVHDETRIFDFGVNVTNWRVKNACLVLWNGMEVWGQVNKQEMGATLGWILAWPTLCHAMFLQFVSATMNCSFNRVKAKVYFTLYAYARDSL